MTARLEPQGLCVYRADNVDEVLRIVRRTRLGLALLDARPPELKGLRLLRRIRSVRVDLPCLLLAGRINGRYLRRALALQATSVLTTPVDEKMLRDLIAAVFRRFYESELDL